MSVMDNGFTFKAALRETSRKIDKIAAMVAAQSGDAHCIEYLESTGTQYVDTEVVPTDMTGGGGCPCNPLR